MAIKEEERVCYRFLLMLKMIRHLFYLADERKIR